MKRIIFIILFFFYIINFNAYAAERISIVSLFDRTEKDTVLKGGIITKSFLKNAGSAHTPNTNPEINIPLTQYTGADLKDYEMLCIEKAFFPYVLTSESKLSVYNILASASKLTGMRYFSRTDSKSETLILNSGRIESPEKKTSVKEVAYGTISPKIINYFITTDNRFGELTFRSELNNEGYSFILKNVCIEPMEKYFISINNKEEYQLISFYIYDKAAGGYFYYSINAMRIRSSYFLKLGMLSAENFANRIRGSTVHMAKLLGIDWDNRIKAFD
jgi:hypothetical protein